MKTRYVFVGRRRGSDDLLTGQYEWKAYRGGVFVGRYVAMVPRFWSGEPLPNAYFWPPSVKP